MSKAARFFVNLMRLVFSGEYSEALFEISLHLPVWLYAFDRGYGLSAGIDQIDAATNSFSDYRVKKVAQEEIDSILELSRMSLERISYFLDQGVSCFVAAPPGMDWSSIGWFAYGDCFVRGMGFRYDFGNNPYTFGLFTQDEARRMGLNRLIIAASLEEARKRGSKTVYSIVEFTNPYALSFHRKLGYHVFLNIFYIKVLGLRISHVKNLDTNQDHWRLFFTEPKNNVTII